MHGIGLDFEGMILSPYAKKLASEIGGKDPLATRIDQPLELLLR